MEKVLPVLPMAGMLDRQGFWRNTFVFKGVKRCYRRCYREAGVTLLVTPSNTKKIKGVTVKALIDKGFKER